MNSVNNGNFHFGEEKLNRAFYSPIEKILFILQYFLSLLNFLLHLFFLFNFFHQTYFLNLINFFLKYTFQYLSILHFQPSKEATQTTKENKLKNQPHLPTTQG